MNDRLGNQEVGFILFSSNNLHKPELVLTILKGVAFGRRADARIILQMSPIILLLDFF